MDSNQFLVTEVKKSCFNASNLESDLNKLLVEKVNKEIAVNSE